MGFCFVFFLDQPTSEAFIQQICSHDHGKEKFGIYKMYYAKDNTFKKNTGCERIASDVLHLLIFFAFNVSKTSVFISHQRTQRGNLIQSEH